MNAQPHLSFRPDGSFKILYLSDFQEPVDHFDPRTMAAVEKLLDREAPDLVFFTGDTVDGHKIRSAEDLSRYLATLTTPLVARGIPFCHVFGNHDYDAAVPGDEQMALYHSIPGCVTGTAPGIPGCTNFALPVYGADGCIKAAIWGLDSGNMTDGVRPGLQKAALLPGIPAPASIWGIVQFEQIMWYWSRSLELERESGAKVPGILACHIAPWEFDYMRSAPEALHPVGNTGEVYNLGALNSGLFAALVQRGDVKCVLAGHTHENTAQAEYCGIQMCSVGSAGYSAYGIDALRGGRVVELSEADPWHPATRMAYFTELDG